MGVFVCIVHELIVWHVYVSVVVYIWVVRYAVRMSERVLCV